MRQRLPSDSVLISLLVIMMTTLGWPSTASAAGAPPAPGTFVIDGAVATPMTLSVADLAPLPQQSVSVSFQSGNRTETHTERGPLLTDVLAMAGPRVDAAIKNGQLRLTVTVAAIDGYQVTYAYGELDANFGARPMILATEEDGSSLAASGPRVVVPGDVRGGRYVSAVTHITVGVVPTTAADASTPGNLALRGDVKTPVTATFSQLTSLATQSMSVTFQSGNVTETHTEQVAPLNAVLALAGGANIDPTAKNGTLRTVITGTGSDGYGAAITAGEADATFGARAAFISVAEDGASLASKGPRLIIVGDKRGGRLVSQLTSLTVSTPRPGTDQPPHPSDQAQVLLGADGGVFALGTAAFAGAATGFLPPGAHAVAIAAHPGGGYWIASDAGGVYAFGNSPFFGAPNTLRLDSPIAAIASTPSGHGYLVASRGGAVFAYGDAVFAGSLNGMTLAAPIVSIIPTPSGRGYWLAGRDGGVFAFGDATFLGSSMNVVATPTAGMAATPSGKGYWIAFTNGTVHAYGDASALGDLSGVVLRQTIVAIHASPSGVGYRLVSRDGGTFNFAMPFLASLAGKPLAAPIIAG